VVKIQRLVPMRGRRKRVEKATFPFNLDGRVIAESVSAHLARASTFPRKASQGDTYASYAAPD